MKDSIQTLVCFFIKHTRVKHKRSFVRVKLNKVLQLTLTFLLFA